VCNEGLLGSRRARRAGAIFAGVVLLATSATGCDWPARTRYVHPVFASDNGTTNIVYRTTTTYTGAAIDLKLDIYQPVGDTATERPVMMWMHGGYWIGGSKENMTAYAKDSATRGYVGVTIQYRLRNSIADFSAAALDAYDDSVAAAQWLEAHAAQYRIDPDAIIAAGYSAGAVNAMNLVFLPPDRGPATSPVDGGVSISGLSFAAPRAHRAKIIMFHGTNDPLVPYASGEGVCQQTRAAGNGCEFVPYQGAGHEIGGTQVADIQARTHDYIFEQILLPLGYKAVQLPAGT